ncbi:hypothetical protein FF38_10140 [Lucilia cuprina]|uniref:Uncharacterized protein n=1 Tax=Lucilia cuprina TaxID=7375 RepID=A0A0L0BZX5_LUCCU|nr:hypothetical protein FF38_10140 [Lucilia cuprina]
MLLLNICGALHSPKVITTNWYRGRPETVKAVKCLESSSRPICQCASLRSSFKISASNQPITDCNLPSAVFTYDLHLLKFENLEKSCFAKSAPIQLILAPFDTLSSSVLQGSLLLSDFLQIWQTEGSMNTGAVGKGGGIGPGEEFVSVAIMENFENFLQSWQTDGSMKTGAVGKGGGIGPGGNLYRLP